jgi:hypothetical protein
LAERSTGFERAVARRLQLVFGEEFVRQRAAAHTDGDGPPISAPDLWIECERGRDADPGSLLVAAEAEAAGTGLWPVIISKDGHGPATVHMLLDHFSILLREWWSARLRRTAIGHPTDADRGAP